MRAIIIPVLAAAVAAGLAPAAAPDPLPPDDSPLSAAALRFSLTSTNDPAYNEVLAAYCREIRTSIEGMPEDPYWAETDRGGFRIENFASGMNRALVGRGMWKHLGHEIHVLDDHPLWCVMETETNRVCGCSVSIQQIQGDGSSALVTGIDRAQFDAAAEGNGLPVRRQDEPEFPPIGAFFRKDAGLLQYDAWLPRKSFRRGESVRVYLVLQNRGDSPVKVDYWGSVIEKGGDETIAASKGPDGGDERDFGLYRDHQGTWTLIEPKPDGSLVDGSPPDSLIPPHAALVHILPLNDTWDVTQPGIYEIHATYPSTSFKQRSRRDVFDGVIPAPPVRFRVLPPWPVLWGRRALVLLPFAIAITGWWIHRRRRASHPACEPSGDPAALDRK